MFDQYDIKNSTLVKSFLVAVIFLVILFIPFTSHSTTSEPTDYNTTYQKSPDLFLGEKQIITQGSKGVDDVTFESSGSILQRIFTPGSLPRQEVNRAVVSAPVDELDKEGTLKKQYMYCTDGSYMSYTDEQFNDPNTGFTDKSPDACAQQGHGTETMLGDSAPQSVPQVQSGGGAICSDGSRSYSTGRGTCSHHGGVSQWL